VAATHDEVKVEAVLKMVLTGVVAAFLALPVVVLAVAFFYLYCLPFLMR